MGALATILSTEAAEREGVQTVECKCDLGGAQNVTAKLCLPSGFDARPLPGDSIALLETQTSGGFVGVGFVDPKTERLAADGEQRIYARDAGGATAASVWVKADGTVMVEATGAVEVRNGQGAMKLDASGMIDLNGVKIDPTGNVTAPGTVAVTGEVSGASIAASTSLKIGVLEVATHIHTAPPGGGPTTGPIGP
jgi:hypothetical protein